MTNGNERNVRKMPTDINSIPTGEYTEVYSEVDPATNIPRQVEHTRRIDTDSEPDSDETVKQVDKYYEGDTHKLADILGELTSDPDYEEDIALLNAVDFIIGRIKELNYENADIDIFIYRIIVQTLNLILKLNKQSKYVSKLRLALKPLKKKCGYSPRDHNAHF